MKSLVLGGTKSGKSRYAELLAQREDQPVTLLATARPDDEEMAARILQHQTDRDSDWLLVEEPLSLGSALSKIPSNHTVVVDCLTLWMTNLLLLEDGATLEEEKTRFLECLGLSKQRLIIVSNETSMGVMPLGALTRQYCDEIGLMHQRLAERCDEVVLVIAGLPQVLKSAS